jgi:hypothetical protein
VVAAYLRSGNAPSRYLRGNQAQRLALAQSEGAIYGSGLFDRLNKSAQRIGDPIGFMRNVRRGGARSNRAAVVKQVMAEQGLSLPQASRYVKENGIAY